jgi:hypothetical protein
MRRRTPGSGDSTQRASAACETTRREKSSFKFMRALPAVYGPLLEFSAGKRPLMFRFPEAVILE